MTSEDAVCTIALFGGLRIEQDGHIRTRFRTHRTALLLAYLACFSDQKQTREKLIQLFWPDVTSPDAGRTSLSVALSSLRSQLESPGVPHCSILLADRESVGLSSLVITDVTLFKHHRAAAKEARAAGDSRREKQHLLDALTVYRDSLLPDYKEKWIVSLRSRFSEQSLLSQQRLEGLRQE